MYTNLKILTAAILLNFSCKRECYKEPCTPLDPKYATWLPNNVGDSIKFRNSAGTIINFVTKVVKISSECSVDCFSQYSSSPKIYSTFETTDTSRKIFINGQQRIVTYNQNEIAVNLESSNYVLVSYFVFDQANQYIIFPTFQYSAGYSVLPTFTAGSISYSDVLVHQTDTTNLNGKFFVWKSYYNKEKGIIGFEDKKTNSFFYRTN